MKEENLFKRYKREQITYSEFKKIRFVPLHTSENMKIIDTYDKSIKDILNRYAYNMFLYWGKPELEEEYKKMLDIIERDIKHIRETRVEEYKLNIEHESEITVIADSFTAQTTQDGDIELVIKLIQ